MNIKKALRKTLGGLFAGGATISMGFLSFAGMFLISPGLGLCISALVLAIAYEGQVYNEGISIALRRIFDADYLKKAIARRYINEEFKTIRQKLRTHLNLDEDPKLQLLDIQNTFLKAYYEHKTYLAKLEENHHLSNELKANKIVAKRNLANLELLFIQYVYRQNTEGNELTNALHTVVDHQVEVIRKELNRKKWLVRFSWLFALAGGVSSGLAALSAIEAGVATLATTFTVLAAIPGGVMITLAVFAAAGYTFMLYQTMTDMVQEYNGKWKNYLARRENENTIPHILRMVGTVLVVALGIFATVATAGTWWYATQKGALFIKMGNATADLVRNISVPLMMVATLSYNITNSVSSVDKISRSDYRNLIGDYKDKIVKAYKAENIIQFLNPFRMIALAIDYTARGLFFIGHIISMGLTTDNLDPIPPLVNAIGSGLNEATVDMNYLPNDEDEHHHSHSSALLNIIFLPVTLVVILFKVLALYWDAPFAGFRAAKEKFFSHCHTHPEIPPSPVLLERWDRGHAFIQVRLHEENPHRRMNGHVHHHEMNEQHNPQLNGQQEQQPLLQVDANGIAGEDDEVLADNAIHQPPRP